MLDVVGLGQAMDHCVLESYFGEPLFDQVKGDEAVSAVFGDRRRATFDDGVVESLAKDSDW